MLELRKLERGELAPRAQPFCVRDALRAVIQMCAMAKCGAADILFMNEQPREEGNGADAAALPERVEGDAVLVSLIVQNLLVNGLKYGDNSRVCVTAAMEAADAAATVPDSTHDGCDGCGCGAARALLRVDVSDCGGGIAEADQARIFAKYERAASDTGASGAGLGLHISRGFARAMGGDITVRSALGHGATFTMRVPVRVLSPTAPACSANVASAAAADADDAADDAQSAAKKPRLASSDTSASSGVSAASTVAAPDLSSRLTPERLARPPPLKDAFAEVSLQEMLTHVLHDSSEVFVFTRAGGIDGSSDAGDGAPHVAYVSPSVRTVLGWAPEALLGAQCSLLVHPDDVDKHSAGAAAMMAEPVSPCMFGMRRMACADGSYRWMHLEVHKEVHTEVRCGDVENAHRCALRRLLTARCCTRPPPAGAAGRRHVLLAVALQGVAEHAARVPAGHQPRSAVRQRRQ